MTTELHECGGHGEPGKMVLLQRGLVLWKQERWPHAATSSRPRCLAIYSTGAWVVGGGDGATAAEVDAATVFSETASEEVPVPRERQQVSPQVGQHL